MKQVIKQLIIASALAAGLVGVIMTAWTFFGAYYSPTKQVITAVNNYGEAKFEFFYTIGMLVLVLSGTFLYLKDIRGKTKQVETNQIKNADKERKSISL